MDTRITKQILMIKRMFMIIATLLIIAFIPACATTPPTPFYTDGNAMPPYGALIMRIDRSAQLNEFDDITPEEMVNEEEVYPILQDVLEKLHDRFYEIDDMEQFGEREYWALPQESLKEGYIVGDCDEFALYSWAELNKRGIRARLVATVTETGGSHMVVEVNGWILDSRDAFVVPRDHLDYEWIKISDYDLRKPWKKIVSM